MSDAAILTLGILIARVGHILYTSGLCGARASGTAAVYSLIDLCVAVLAFWAFGAAIALGNAHNLLGMGLLREWPLAFFATLLSLSSMIPLGALGGRLRLRAVVVISAVLAGAVAPLVFHLVLEKLNNFGLLDQGGATYIHLTGAVWALIGVVACRPRNGAGNTASSRGKIAGENITITLTGALLLAMGLICVILGLGGAGIAMNNAILGLAAGGFSATLVAHGLTGRSDVRLILGGILGGVVSLTAAPGYLPGYGAVITGLAAGALVPWFILKIDRVAGLDDPAGAIAIHGIGAMIALVSAALFFNGDAGQRFSHLGKQLLCASIVVSVATSAAIPTFALLRGTRCLRISAEDERVGMDRSQLGASIEDESVSRQTSSSILTASRSEL